MARPSFVPRLAVHASALGLEQGLTSSHPGHLPEQEPEDVAALGGAGPSSADAAPFLPEVFDGRLGEADATTVAHDATAALCSVFAQEQMAPVGHDASREVTLVDWQTPHAASSSSSHR